MRKFKAWLYDRFLPAYCQDGIKEENRRLAGAVAELKQENETLRAYIDGLRDAMKYIRKVQITVGGDSSERIVRTAQPAENTKS